MTCVHFTNVGRSLECLDPLGHPHFNHPHDAIDATSRQVKTSLQSVLAMRQSQALDSRIRTTAEINLSIAKASGAAQKLNFEALGISGASICEALDRDHMQKLSAANGTISGLRFLVCSFMCQTTTICCPGMPRSASLALSETLLKGFHWTNLQVDASPFKRMPQLYLRHLRKLFL